jgi:hypothetical protein
LKVFDLRGQSLLNAPLSRERFAASLRRGHGRALLHVRKFGLSDVADLVLEACLRNQTYDAQCEEPRAPWLFEMFRDAPEYPEFSKAICTELEADIDQTNILLLLCDLAALMAQNGDGDAHRALRARVLRQVEHESDKWIGCSALVLCEGAPALVELARRFGAQLRAGVSDSDIPVLYDLMDDDFSETQRAALLEAETDDAEVRAWCDLVRDCLEDTSDGPTQSLDERKRERREQYRAANSLESILERAAAKKDGVPGHYGPFGKYATEAELKTVFQKLLDETDEAVCIRLLWVFSLTAPPELHPRLWEFVESENKDLRDAAIDAMVHFEDARIVEFGRSLLASSEIDPEDRDDAHWLGSTLLDICERNRTGRLADLLTWVYEMNPCGICRYRAVELMAETHVLSDEIRAECLCDVDEDTRRISSEAARYGM